VYLRTGLDAVDKGKIFFILLGLEPRLSCTPVHILVNIKKIKIALSVIQFHATTKMLRH
jgi:hypothetical protein